MAGKRFKRRVCLPVLTGIVLFVAVSSVAAQPTIIVAMGTVDSPHCDNRLSQKIEYGLSQIVTPISVVSREVFDRSGAGQTSELERIISFGRNHQARFIVDVLIDRIELTRKKVTILPILVFRYRTYAVLSGRLRIFDLERGRAIAAEKISCEIKASDQWQISEDDPDHPSLMIPADQKIILFDALERQAADDILDKIKSLAKK